MRQGQWAILLVDNGTLVAPSRLICRCRLLLMKLRSLLALSGHRLHNLQETMGSKGWTALVNTT